MTRRYAIAAAVIFGQGLAGGAFAADWEALPFGSIGGYYESNLGLSPVSGQELQVTGAAASAGVALHADTPVSTLLLRPYLRSAYFPSHSDSDYINLFTDLDYRHQGTKSIASLLGEFAHETVNSRALPTTTPRGDLGNPTDGDVNSAGIRSRRTMFGFYPSLTYDVTQRGRLEVSGNYSDVRYDRKLPGEELGYSYERGAIGYGFNLSPVNSLSLTAAVDGFNPEDIPGQSPSVGSSTYSLTARWSKSISATQRWYLQGGGSQTSFDQVAGVSQRKKSGYIGGIGGSWELQKSTVFADLVHRVQPSSSGAVSNQTDARLQLVRRVTATWSGTLGVRYIRSDAVATNAATDYRDYGTLNLGVEWRWTRTLSLQGNAAYVRQKLENQPRAGDSKQITLSVAYDAGRKN